MFRIVVSVCEGVILCRTVENESNNRSGSEMLAEGILSVSLFRAKYEAIIYSKCFEIMCIIPADLQAKDATIVDAASAVSDGGSVAAATRLQIEIIVIIL